MCVMKMLNFSHETFRMPLMKLMTPRRSHSTSKFCCSFNGKWKWAKKKLALERLIELTSWWKYTDGDIENNEPGNENETATTKRKHIEWNAPKRIRNNVEYKTKRNPIKQFNLMAQAIKICVSCKTICTTMSVDRSMNLHCPKSNKNHAKGNKATKNVF